MVLDMLSQKVEVSHRCELLGSDIKEGGTHLAITSMYVILKATGVDPNAQGDLHGVEN